jgi:hypothetical protein
MASDPERWRPILDQVNGAAPPAEYPPLATQAGNLAKAAVRFAASGMKTVDKAEYDRRLAICKACEHYDAKQARCVLCGCRTKYKLRMATESCPLDPPKWNSGDSHLA